MSLHPLSRYARFAEPPSPAEHDCSVASMAAGDLDALRGLYDYYAGRAFAVAWSILGTKGGAGNALTAGTVDFWRICTYHRPAVASGGWLLCRVSAHALDHRRLGHGVPGRLSSLTDTQSQVLALATAGRMSRGDIAAEIRISPTLVARAMSEALVLLRASPATADGFADAGGTRTPGRVPAKTRRALRACRLDERAH